MEALRREPSMAQLGRLLQDLRGSFAIFYRNVQTDTTVCVTDRMASRQIWRGNKDRHLIFGTHASSIAAILQPRTFDPAALAAFLLYGGAVDPRRSLFREVIKVPPGVVLKCDGLGEWEEWPWYRFRHRPARMSTAGWTDLAAQRLTAAATRINALEPELTIFFSGGVDSRLAAAALRSAGGAPRLLTLGDESNVEVRVAARAAQALGLKHEVFWRDRYSYLRNLRANVFASAGNYGWKHGHFAAGAQSHLRAYPNAAFMLGDFCEAFSKLCCAVASAGRGPWSEGQFADQFDTLPLPLYRPTSRGLTLGLLSRKARIAAEAGLRNDLCQRYAEMQLNTADPLILMDQFFRWNDAGTIATFLMFLDLRSVGPERNLMFDADVHELLELLPSDMRDSANFGARLIARLAPKAAWVPNSNTLLPLCFPPVAHAFSRKARPWIGRLRRWWLDDPLTNPGSWPSFEALYVQDSVWRQYIDKTIRHAELLGEDLFDRGAIIQAWEELLQGHTNRVVDVENVITLAEVTRMLKEGVGAFLQSPVQAPGPKP